MGVIFGNWLNTMNIQAVNTLTSLVLITRFSKTKRKILLATELRLTLEFYDPGPAFR